jgi:four helix bundle protein
MIVGLLNWRFCVPYQDIGDSRMCQRAERLADLVWEVVIKWKPFARDTVGTQLARAADSIGANIAESAGRYSPGDVIRFLHFARGSLRETKFWLKRARKRQLVPSAFYDQQINELNTLAAELNAYIKYQRQRKVKEPTIEYEAKPTHQLSN